MRSVSGAPPDLVRVYTSDYVIWSIFVAQCECNIILTGMSGKIFTALKIPASVAATATHVPAVHRKQFKPQIGISVGRNNKHHWLDGASVHKTKQADVFSRLLLADWAAGGR